MVSTQQLAVPESLALAKVVLPPASQPRLALPTEVLYKEATATSVGPTKSAAVDNVFLPPSLVQGISITTAQPVSATMDTLWSMESAMSSALPTPTSSTQSVSASLDSPSQI